MGISLHEGEGIFGDDGRLLVVHGGAVIEFRSSVGSGYAKDSNVRKRNILRNVGPLWLIWSLNHSREPVLLPIGVDIWFDPVYSWCTCS